MWDESQTTESVFCVSVQMDSRDRRRIGDNQFDLFLGLVRRWVLSRDSRFREHTGDNLGDRS